MTMFGKKIKVVKCSFEKFWYSDKIGETFTVVEDSTRDYYVLDGSSLRGILIIDTEPLNKKETN
jgi:hypothetical protein